MKSRLHHAPRNDPIKCVRLNDGKVIRVSTDEGEDIVRANRGRFVPKSEWKAQERGEKKAA